MTDEKYKRFPTEVVLSLVTGRLVCEIGDIYKALSWMTGFPVFTHDIPEIMRKVTPMLLDHNPGLQSAVAEADIDNPAPWDWQYYRKLWVSRYGADIEIPRFPDDTKIDRPIPDNAIVVVVSDKTSH